MAFKILLHTFRMIFGNLGQALRVSVGPYIILMTGLFLVLAITSPIIDSTVGVNLVVQLLMLVVLIFTIFVTSWVAVSWHRFILLEEYTSFLPVVKDRPIWPYAGKAVLMALILGLIAGLFFLCFLLLSLVPMAEGGREMGPFFNLVYQFLLITGFFVLAVASLRMGVALVATALGKSMTFRDAVEATSQVSGVIWGVSILLVLINAILGFAISYIAGEVPVLGLFLEIALNWLTTMLGISILTTIYGHVIEDRPLVS